MADRPRTASTVPHADSEFALLLCGESLLRVLSNNHQE
jgi:hypothetical protein